MLQEVWMRFSMDYAFSQRNSIQKGFGSFYDVGIDLHYTEFLGSHHSDILPCQHQLSSPSIQR